MTVTADTIRLISQGEYSVGTNGTISVSDFSIYLQWAEDQFRTDSPGNYTSGQADQAVGLLICHYIDRTKNDQHIKAEDAGDGSTSFDETGSNWMKSYREIILSLETKAERNRQNPVGTYQHPSKPAYRRDATGALGAPASSWLREQ
ncbi:MAG TPA: hypothetical protein VN372_14125 [Methanospirillum sp.]|nr:hypothetical protein [Methanospirillum sp.]